MADNLKRCLNEIINSNAPAWSRSCPRCGFADKCPAGVVRRTADQVREAQREAFEVSRRAAPPLADDGLPPPPPPFHMTKQCTTVADDRIALFTTDQYRQGQREAYEAGCRARAITETLMNPPYGEPDLYARLHTSLMDQIAVAKEQGKLAAWFDAARGLLEYEGGRHGYGAAVPAQTGTQQPAGDSASLDGHLTGTPSPINQGDSVDTPRFRMLLGQWMAARDYWQDDDNERVKACWVGFVTHISTWAARRAAVSTASAPDDPMDWPIPCDMKVGNCTIKKGCKLRTLLARMESLHRMAVAAMPKVTPEQRAEFEALFAAPSHPVEGSQP